MALGDGFGNDAVLGIRVEDDATPVLARIQKEVERLGSTYGASARQIETANKQISGSLGRLTENRNWGGQMSQQTRTAATALERYRRELREAEIQASRFRLTSSGRFQSVETGRFVPTVNATDAMRSYQVAQQNVETLRQKVLQLNEAQRQGTKSGRDFQASLARSGDFKARAQLQAMYEGFAAAGWGAEKAAPKLGMFTRAQQGLNTALNASNSTRYALYDVASSMGIAGAAHVAAGAASVVFAAKWESAFAAVRRTTQASDYELA